MLPSDHDHILPAPRCHRWYHTGIALESPGMHWNRIEIALGSHLNCTGIANRPGIAPKS